MVLRRLVVLGWFALVVAVQASACSTTGPSKSNDDDGDGGGSGGDITVACEDQCTLEHPAGQEAYNLVRSCLFCGACFDVCTAENAGLCPNGGGDLGCSIGAADCASCVALPCGLAQNPDTTFQGHCAQYGQACADNPECVSLNNCVVSCVEAGGPTTASATGAGGATATGGAMSSSATGG